MVVIIRAPNVVDTMWWTRQVSTDRRRRRGSDLQRMLIAGARSVVVSLWNVDDTATQLLMSRFYENLWGLREGSTEPMSKIAALHEAKEWLRSLDRLAIVDQVKKRGLQLQLAAKPEANTATATDQQTAPPHSFELPHFWAAFILVGDWQ